MVSTRSTGKAETASPAAKSPKKVMKDSDDDVVKEFGGPVGALIIMFISHALVYYIWICVQYYEGSFVHPSGLSDIVPFFSRMWDHVVEGAAPTLYAAGIFLAFLGFQAVLAVTMPGVYVQGLPVPSEGGKQLTYRANGVWAWYVTLATIGALYYFDIWRLSAVLDNFGAFLTVAVIFSDVLSILAYFSAIVMGKAVRMSGNPIYDIFMGAWLNPRIGLFDLKYWAETRVAWIMLFLLTASAAVKQIELEGFLSWPMGFMLLAHGLYTNACMKGEECVPYTWDVFYEKWGWMLIFWNFAGVPFVYCAQARYLLHHRILSHFSPYYTAALFGTLLFAYFVWDTAQSQRNRFRMKLRGTYIPRKSFPQLPWGTLQNPEYMETKVGSKLLVDGWWRYARKIHYTADVVMGLTWGLNCQFNHFLPYFYVTFFSIMITHRYLRDAERCRRKYGADWDKYCAKVPYVFIPFVI